MTTDNKLGFDNIFVDGGDRERKFYVPRGDL